MSLALGGYGLSTANASSDRGAAGGPAPLPPPIEPASQLTVDINGAGVIALPYRTTALCDAQSPCPTGLLYTTIGVGKIVVQLNNPTGLPATVRLARSFGRRMDAKHTSATVRARLRNAQYLLTVKTKTSTHQIVVWATLDPYSPPTTTGNDTIPPPTTGMTPTTLPAAHHVVVTFDDTGVQAAPSTSPAGQTGVLFVDHRSNPTGHVLLHIEVQPHLGDPSGIAAGNDIVRILCPHNWYLRVTVDDVDAGHAFLLVDGTDPQCTTPIT